MMYLLDADGNVEYQVSAAAVSTVGLILWDNNHEIVECGELETPSF